MEEHVLFIKGAVDFSLFKDHLIEIVAGHLSGLGRPPHPSLSRWICNIGTAGMKTLWLHSCGRVLAHCFLLMSSHPAQYLDQCNNRKMGKDFWKGKIKHFKPEMWPCIVDLLAVVIIRTAFNFSGTEINGTHLFCFCPELLECEHVPYWGSVSS